MIDGALAWPCALALLGIIVGSFVAALAVRWPQGRSIAAGRSACDRCGRQLRARDLVPVASFIALGGQCGYCGRPIDRRHLAIELLGGAIGATAGMTSPGFEGAAGAVFGWLLLALGALDLAAFWLPDRLTGTLATLGLGAGAAGLGPTIDERLTGGAAGFGVLWVVAAAYRRLRGREGMGGGDPKLLGAIGLWLGWRTLPAVVLTASAIGLGVALLATAAGRPMTRDTALPFGVFLAAAAYPAWMAMLWLTP